MIENNENIIFKVFIKPDYDTRTFESRLLFIRQIFEETFDTADIMGRCIQYKLTESYKDYEKQITQSANYLMDRDPLAVIKRMKSNNI